MSAEPNSTGPEPSSTGPSASMDTSLKQRRRPRTSSSDFTSSTHPSARRRIAELEQSVASGSGSDNPARPPSPIAVDSGSESEELDGVLVVGDTGPRERRRGFALHQLDGEHLFFPALLNTFL
jgi:hypothetical protein